MVRGMAHPEQKADFEPPVSIMPGRLAYPLTGGVAPTWEVLGLSSAVKVGMAWQKERAYAERQQFAALRCHPDVSDWVPVLYGIIGVVGEQVLVAAQAEVEKAICSDRLAALASDRYAARASLSRSLRFFAEGQANAVTVAAHGLANLVLRTLALDPNFKATNVKGSGYKAEHLKPGVASKGAWLSLNLGTCTVLTKAAGGCSPEMRDLTKALSDLQTDNATRTLIDLRNTQYHRWRGESPGVTGVDVTAPSLRESMARDGFLELDLWVGPTPPYVEGQQMLDGLVKASREGLDALVIRLDRLLKAWDAAYTAAMT